MSVPRQLLGDLNIGNQTYRFGSGGAGAFPIPRGDWPITPNVMGPWGTAHNAIGLNNDQPMPDATAGRDRTGIEIHAALNQGLITAGCVGIDPTDYAAVQAAIKQVMAKNGQAYLSVDENGELNVLPWASGLPPAASNSTTGPAIQSGDPLDFSGPSIGPSIHNGPPSVEPQSAQPPGDLYNPYTLTDPALSLGSDNVPSYDIASGQIPYPDQPWDYSTTGQTTFGDQSAASGFNVSQDPMGYNPTTENRNIWQDIADGFTNAFQSYPVPGVYADNGSQSVGGNIGDFQPNGDFNQPYQTQSDFNPSLGSDLNSGIYSGPQPASYFNQAQWDAGTGGYDANGQWQTWEQPSSMSPGDQDITNFGGSMSLGSDVQPYQDYQTTPVAQPYFNQEQWDAGTGGYNAQGQWENYDQSGWNAQPWQANASQPPWQANATSSQSWQSNAASEPWQYSASHPANDYLPTYADALALGHGAVLPMNPTDALSMDYANLSSLGYSLGPMVSLVGASGWANNSGGPFVGVQRPAGLA